MKRSWNWHIYAGFGVVVFAFVSYFLFFSQFPLTRDVPWLNLLLFALGLGLLGIGSRRGWSQREHYRGRIAGPTLTALSALVLGFFLFYSFSFSAQLPESRGAPKVGEAAPDFTLPDQQGKPVKLSELRGQPVLLVFYRGYW